MSDYKFLILSCDGGGIRGLITSMIIQQIDTQLKQDGKPSFLDKIDLFTGTSTGGIIALSLASGVPISELVQLYSNSCSEIFTPYNPTIVGPKWLQNIEEELEQLLPSEVQNVLENLENLLYVKYNNTGLEDVLKTHFNPPSQTLASLKSKVLVTAFQLDNKSNSTDNKPGEKNIPSWQPITLDNLPNNQINSGETQILDAALCTSAAPTFFPPHQHPTYGLCVDGGVFANNPSTLSLARVINSGILGDRNLQDIRMLSIGTGVNRYALLPDYQPAGPLRYGATTWLWPEAKGETPGFPLLEILMDSSSIIDDFQANMFLGKNQYERINVNIPEGTNIAIDDCSQIKTMENLVTEYIQSPKWKENISWIENHFL